MLPWRIARIACAAVVRSDEYGFLHPSRVPVGLPYYVVVRKFFPWSSGADCWIFPFLLATLLDYLYHSLPRHFLFTLSARDTAQWITLVTYILSYSINTFSLGLSTKSTYTSL